MYHLGIGITEEFRDILKKHASEEHRTLSNFSKIVLEEYIKNKVVLEEYIKEDKKKNKHKGD